MNVEAPLSQVTPTKVPKYIPPTDAQLAAANDWVTRFSQHWQKPDPDRLRELMHPDTQNLIPPMTTPADQEGVVGLFKQVLDQFPDLRIEVLRWAPSGDAVMIEWLASATVGSKLLEWQGVDRVCLRDNRTYQGQVYWDTRRVAEQVAQARAL
jgi:SnoaL-like domain